MVRRLMILLVAMILNMSLISGITVAWFTDTTSIASNPDTVNLSSGTMIIDVETETNSFDDIRPGYKEVVEGKITNKGSLDVLVKLDEMEAKWDREDDYELQSSGTRDSSDIVDINFSGDWERGASAEIRSVSLIEPVYYFNQPVEAGETVDFQMTVEFCEDMCADYSNKNFTIDGKVYAIQATKEALNSLNWDTNVYQDWDEW